MTLTAPTGTLLIHRYHTCTMINNDVFQKMSRDLFGILVIDPLNLSDEAKEYLVKNELKKK